MIIPSTYEDHLLEIIRAPEDDQLRLALAALLRRSEPAFARLIELQVRRVQCQRAMGDFETERVPDDERCLLAQHATAWSRGAAQYANHTPSGGPAITFYRGLISLVAIDPEVFMEHSAHVLVQGPIRHVDFAPLRPGVLVELLACEALGQLDSIGFVGTNLDAAGVAAIAQSPHLTRCLFLDLSRNALGPEAFAAIADSPRLRELLVVEGAPCAALPRSNRVSRFDARWYVDHVLQ